MQRTLLIASAFPPSRGGIQSYLYGLYSGLPGDSFRVLARRDPGWDEFDRLQSFKVDRVPCIHAVGPLKNIPLLLAAAHSAIRDRVRYLHCGTLFPDGRVGCVLKRLFGTRYLVYTYAKELYGPPAYEAEARKILTNADMVVTISRFTRDRLIELGVGGERIEIIPPGVDAEFFRPQEKDAGLARALGLDGRKVVLSVGRLIERKGFDTVLRALPEVAKVVPEVCYVIAGDGPYLPMLNELAADLGMQEHIAFTGPPEGEDLLKYYGICDVFAMVSRVLSDGDCEGFGIVFLEAGACGRPVIGSLSGGIPDAVEDGVTGFLVGPMDVRALADRLVCLLTDRGLAESMGEAGRRRAVQKFTVQRQSQRLADLIGRPASIPLQKL